MQVGVSLKLKKAMLKVDKIMNNYDISGAVFLADGLKNGEYKIYADSPSWSMIRFIPRADGSMAVHTKAYMSSKPTETNRTVNALYNTMNMMGNIFLMLKSITTDLESKIEIDDMPGKLIPHRPLKSEIVETYYLKTWPEYFAKVLDGSKEFELRKDDRGIKEGETIVLQEWCPDKKDYTGKELPVAVTYKISDASDFGLMPGYCILGIKKI